MSEIRNYSGQKKNELEINANNDGKLLKETKEIIRWKSSPVQVNNLLTNFKEIQKTLEGNGIRISEYFGSKSVPTNVPTINLITFGSQNPTISRTSDQGYYALRLMVHLKIISLHDMKIM